MPCDDPSVARHRAVESSAQIEPLAIAATADQTRFDIEGTITHITTTLDPAGTNQLRIEVAGARPGLLTGVIGAKPALPLHEGDAIHARFECAINFHGRFCSGYVTDAKDALLLAVAVDRDDLAPGFRCEVGVGRCTTAGDLLHEVRFVAPNGDFVTSDNRWELLSTQGARYDVWGSAREVIDKEVPDAAGARSCLLMRRGR